MMNLQDFISESLSQLVKGVIDAQNGLKDTGALVVPEMSSTLNTASIGSAKDRPGQPVTLVEFDILVTVFEKKESGFNLGVAFSVISGGGKSGKKSDYGENSRMKFGVPLVLPTNI